MAKLAVLASGNGSNFEALAEAIQSRPRADGPAHDCVILIYDRKAAFAAERAARLGIASRYVPYIGRGREEAEMEISALLREYKADLVALAGFMRVLSPEFARAWKGRVVNIHPSLLPKWPGAHAIQDAFNAGERLFGVTIHYIDEGVDTGPIIAQESFRARAGESVESIEQRTHAVEHRLYPKVVLDLLDAMEAKGHRT
jgi:phosphoribosylglycinamide formyltransferase-1